LFTNAGMVQFKDVFLGRDKRSYSRAASSQRCVRAGGKHNDLENVGYTARHHTFFEMLGNFSFGDYFKREAIDFAWEFLTEELKIPQEKLWITVYEEDDEAEEIWLNEIGVDPERMSRCGAKDNFWAMGDTGPCGPCSEIFYDHGPDVWGGPPGSAEEDGDRYIEIWNLVFTQFNRDSDGNLTPLPRPSVDTGMGLERLAAVMQGVHSNYEIDLFTNLIAAVVDVIGGPHSDEVSSSLKVIADHIRSCAFMIVDGVLPSNEGRGYVLRRIIRRAIRHGYMLGTKEPFFYRLVEPLCQEMGEAYPELPNARAEVERVLLQEEERFAETLEQGMKILSQEIEGQEGKQISGEVVFKLYDTYGFPTDLTADIARERDMTLDMDGFEREMEAQRERARAASRFGSDQTVSIDMEGETDFTGYERQEEQATIIALIQNGETVDTMGDNEEGMVVLDRTPFYAEAGGQVGDSGRLLLGDDYFEVVDTRKQGSDLIIHSGRFHGPVLHVGDSVDAQVDRERRGSIVLNHSATHLLHAALRKILGEHVTQKGSLVDSDRLRFDFSHHEPVSREQLQEIERVVNRQIRANDVIETRIMSLEDAKASGAVALFGEKYSEQVRVLRIGEFSTELCGGTHAKEAGEIGLFKITAEMGIASGVRRIEAVTGEQAISWVAADEERLWRLADILKVGRDGLEERVLQMTETARQLEKELEQLKGKLASAAGSDLASSAVDVHGVKVLAARLDGADAKSLRDTMDQLKSKLGSAAIVLAAVDGDKVSLVAGITKDQIKQLKAGDLVKMVAAQVGGKGGGRPDLAQAGGNKPEALDGALASVMPWVEEQLSG
jgi:alanyl-tRNA synthetase